MGLVFQRQEQERENMDNPSSADDQEDERKPAPRSTAAGSVSIPAVARDKRRPGGIELVATGEAAEAASSQPSAEKQPPVPLLTARKRENKTLAELDAMADELRLAAMPLDEKSKQMGLIYSRRKRLKKQKRVEDLMKQGDEIRNDIVRLRNENARLRSIRQSGLIELSTRLEVRRSIDRAWQGQVRTDLLPTLPGRAPFPGRAPETSPWVAGQLYHSAPQSLLTMRSADASEALRMLRMRQALASSWEQQSILPIQPGHLSTSLLGGSLPTQAAPSSALGSQLSDLGALCSLDALGLDVAGRSAMTARSLNPASLLDPGAARPRDALDVAASQLAAARELEGARRCHRTLIAALDQARGPRTHWEGSLLAAQGPYSPGLNFQGPSSSLPNSVANNTASNLIRHQDRLDRLAPNELSAFLDNVRGRTSPLEEILVEFERKKSSK
jgi:hypothetical protein